MLERNISNLIRIQASTYGCILFRNSKGAFKNKKGAVYQYGLIADGSSDLIGIYNGRFVAFEVKQPGEKPSAAQSAFIAMVQKNGGIAGVLTSPDQVADFLK